MNSIIEIIQGDITTLAVDAIVNAANSTLLGGGGVDGAIHRAAGPQLLEECATLGGCPTGEARITRGYNLPASFVIHTVGPVWKDGNHKEPELLAACYCNSFDLARANGVRSIAFPAISCGVFGYPMGKAAEIALTCASSAAKSKDFERIIFVLFNKPALVCYENTARRLGILFKQ